MQRVTVAGLEIAYRRAGAGPTLVLLHGFIADSRAWRTQLDALASDFDVIAWDAPGCGDSTDPGEHFSMAEFAEILTAFLDSIDVAAAHLCGLSWGGTLALEFYRRHPMRVTSLILADTYAGWTGSLGEAAAAERLDRCLLESQLPPAEWIPQWVPHAFSNAAPQSVQDELASVMWDFHPPGFRAMSRAVTPDFRDIFPTVKVPTLLIWGDQDNRSPPAAGEAMRDSIAGARLVVLPHAGHVSNMEQPERFNAQVADFLKSLTPGITA